MRSKLFSVLLIPALTVVVLAWLTVAGRNAQVDQATSATVNAELYSAVADLDNALGVEAMRSAELYQSRDEWQAVKWDLYTSTNTALEHLNDTLRQSGEMQPTAAKAIDTVRQTLSYRQDVENGIMSPLQIVDRYSRARQQLLDGIQEVSLQSEVSDPDLIAILSLVEARSAHLNERLSVDLAITYDQWAPGQHSTTIAAIVSHDTHLRFAASYQQLGNLQISPELLAIRDQVELTSETPTINNDEWRTISDEWLVALNLSIEQSIDQTTKRLMSSQQEASSNRQLIVSIVAVILLFTFIMMLWVSYRLIRRVEAITDQASLLALGLRSTSAASVVGGTDEISSLARAFDDMAGELSRSADVQKIESTALEAIAEGHSIETTLATISRMLGQDSDRQPLYRFVTKEPATDALSVNNPSIHQTPLWIEKKHDSAPDLDLSSDLTRAAIGLATMAQRKADDDALLEGQATFDSLTGLMNRRKILAIANDAVARASSAKTVPGLVYVDLDDFKKVNDSLGHAAGDKILKATARVLVEQTASVGAWAGRIGGDEFIVVLPDTSSDEQLQEFVDNVVATISELDVFEDDYYSVGVSVGGVRARSGVSLNQLMSEADTALYAAKETGRGRAVVSDAELRNRTQEEEKLRAEVVNGLEQNEFVAWYQPIWNDQGTTVCAIEALVRWLHPDGSVRRPSNFLPVLEQQHLLAELDRIIFERVCRDISTWASRGGRVVPVHINVSSMRLEEHGFIEQTMSTLARSAVHPEQIVIEVIESGLMTDIISNGARLQQLRDVGILVATDDFGQGYSSLSYLRDLTVDILKIDRQFVEQIDTIPTNQSIVSAVVGLARSLNLTVVAEGVERTEELQWLIDAGCELFQGFLLGRPCPEPEIRALLGAKRDPRLAANTMTTFTTDRNFRHEEEEVEL